MGECLSYLAIKGKDRFDILNFIDMKPRPESIEGWVEVYKEDTVIGNLNDYILVLDGTWKIFDEKNESQLVELSQNAEVVYGLIEEHVMYSSVGLYKGGCKLWSVVNNPDTCKLEVTGAPPDSFEKATQKAKKLRDETPPFAQCAFEFDIPVDIFQDIVGFCYSKELIVEPNQEFRYLDKK